MTPYVVTPVMFCQVCKCAQVSVKSKWLLLGEDHSSTAWRVQARDIPTQQLYVDVWVWVAAYRDNKFGWREAATAKDTCLCGDSDRKIAGKGGKCA